MLAGGEAGAEAILPLKQFYDRLGDMLDKKLDAIMTGTTVYVYVQWTAKSWQRKYIQKWKKNSQMK